MQSFKKIRNEMQTEKIMDIVFFFSVCLIP